MAWTKQKPMVYTVCLIKTGVVLPRAGGPWFQFFLWFRVVMGWVACFEPMGCGCASRCYFFIGVVLHLVCGGGGVVVYYRVLVV